MSFVIPNDNIEGCSIKLISTECGDILGADSIRNSIISQQAGLISKVNTSSHMLTVITAWDYYLFLARIICGSFRCVALWSGFDTLNRAGLTQKCPM